MKLAKDRGAEVIPGIEMFVHQARPPIRDLDRQARALGRYAARGHAGAAGTQRRPPGTQVLTTPRPPIPNYEHVGAGGLARLAGRSPAWFGWRTPETPRRALLARPDEGVRAYVGLGGA